MTSTQQTRRYGRRHDASMTLLRELTDHPLDAAYQAAAQRCAAGATPSRMSRWLTAAVLAVGGLCVAVAVVQLRQPLPEGGRARQDLENQIQQRIESMNRTSQSITQLREDISRRQAAALQSSDNRQLVEQTQVLAKVAGQESVDGQGVELIVDNAATDEANAQGAENDTGQIRDLDLQMVVNGLWQSGANAVAINGQRLTSRSAIRTAGKAILVSYRPLSPPYSIVAIAESDQLAQRFQDSNAGEYLRRLASDYNIRWSLTQRSHLSLRATAESGLRFAVAPGAVTTLTTTALPTPSPRRSEVKR